MSKNVDVNWHHISCLSLLPKNLVLENLYEGILKMQYLDLQKVTEVYFL